MSMRLLRQEKAQPRAKSWFVAKPDKCPARFRAGFIRTLPSWCISTLFPDVAKRVILLCFDVVSLGADFEEDVVG